MTLTRHIRLEGFTRIDRHTMLPRLRDAFQTGHADLIDFHMFSNTAISISFEVAGQSLIELKEALAASALSLDEESLEALARNTGADDIINGNLNVTFIHDDPDLRIPVPAIPG